MNYPFNNTPIVRRTMVLGAAAVMCMGIFCSCAKKEAETTPSETINLVPSTAATTAPTTAATTAPKKDMAIVNEQLNVRSSPSMESNVISQLDAGDEVEVLRIENVNGIEWAYVRQGWLPTEMLDMSNVSIAQGTANATPNNPNNTEPTTAPSTAPTTEATTAPTTAEENANAGNPNNTTTATVTNTNGKYGVVVTNNLNIRSEASTNGNIVGTLNYGDRVSILQRSNEWGKISSGWINLSYVYLDGENGNNPSNGTVTGDVVNVRTGPGIGYKAVASLTKGTNIKVLEQVKIGNSAWGCLNNGWVCLDYVDLDNTAYTPNSNSGSTNANTSTGSATTGTVTGEVLNIRAGAGTQYDVVGTYNHGDVVNIYERVSVGNVTWGRTSDGWISLAYVQFN